MKKKFGILILSGSLLMASTFFAGCAYKESEGKDFSNFNSNFDHSADLDSETDSVELLATVVRFNSNGGSTVSDATLRYGMQVGQLPVPTKTEYRFIGWKYDDGTNRTFIDPAAPWLYTGETVEFVAEWVPVEYAILLHSNEVEVADFDGKYTYGEEELLPAPVREGYTFKGWYEDASFQGTPVTKIEAGETGNKTYYAKWEESEYTVILHYGYEGCPASEEMKVKHGEGFNIPVPADREGYIFNGWKTADGMFYTNETGEAIRKGGVTQDTQLTADWTKRKTEEEESVGGTFVYETQCKAGDREFIDKIKVKEGYKFEYFTLEDGTKFKFWEELSNIKEQEGTYKVYLHFIREIGFSIYCLADSEANTWREAIIKDFGEEIELPVLSKAGYMFDGWYVMDDEYNRIHFTGTPFEIGSKFDCHTMPDLSVGKEQDGTQIRLEPRFMPIQETGDTLESETLSALAIAYHARENARRLPKEKERTVRGFVKEFERIKARDLRNAYYRTKIEGKMVICNSSKQNYVQNG